MGLVHELLRDDTGRRYRRVLDDPRVDFNEVLHLLDDPEHQRAMEWAERRWGRPALAGVVTDIETLPSVERFLSSFDQRETARFRQAVGVAVRIVMERRGWAKTGDKGTVSGARWFRKAERYRPPPNGRPPAPAPQEDRLARLRAGREAMEALGSDAERRETLDTVLTGLSTERAAEGRPF